MRYRLLGPLEICHGERLIRLGGPRPEKAAAALLLDANRVVSVSRLVGVLWDDAPPANAVKQARNCVSLVRAALSKSWPSTPVTTVGSGYRFTVERDELDVLAFRSYVNQAQQLIRDDMIDQAARQLRAALSLWRGPVLAGLHSRALLPAAAHLNEQRMTTIEQLAELDLRLGRHQHVVGPLTELVGEHPFREQLVGHLMLALYRCGRRADALAAYLQLRGRLGDELGIEPSPQMAALHGHILNADLALQPATSPLATAIAGPAGSPAGPLTVPRQLPSAVHRFTGRHDELKALEALLDQEPGATVVISAIDGTAGIGKTALAVHWAHRAARRFPDGQLYVNLRGFEPSAEPAEPAEVLRGFLDALGVRPERIPARMDAQAALYRSLLAGKRMLIVLDNARHATQVRPLMPGTSGCLVLVTSRNQLTSLVAAEGAQTLTLGLLTHAESHELLARRLGPERLGNQHQAATELIELCARLPLALSIAAARVATQPALPLAAVVSELRQARGRLDALNAGDAATDLRAMFSWSYDLLSDSAARMFRLLGIHPGPDISVPAAASLAGISRDQARAALTELTRSRLLTEPGPSHYAFHDLLRAYAAEQAHVHGSDTDRREAMHRVLDHYLHTVHSADRKFLQRKKPIVLPAPRAGVTPEELADRAEAMIWCQAERQVLLAAIARAAEAGFDNYAWQIPFVLAGFLDLQGHWHDWKATQHSALAAAQRLGDLRTQADASGELGIAASKLRLHEDAREHFERALTLHQQLGDLIGQAKVYENLGWAYQLQDRISESLDCSQQAHDLYREAGHLAGQAGVLSNIGWLHIMLGNYQQAITYCEQSLPLLRKFGNLLGEGGCLDNLGYAHHHLGSYEQALNFCNEALKLFRQQDDRMSQAYVLSHLGDAHRATRNHGAARDSWREALAIFEELEQPDSKEIRAKLAQLPLPPEGENPQRHDREG